MEHPCAKCGNAVEDGTPFCRHCGAPQIRVPAPSVEAADPAYAAAVTAALQQVQDLRRSFVRSALLAGIMGAFGSLFLTPIFMLAAGGFAIAFFHRRIPNSIIPARQGFRLGVLTGFIGSLAFSSIVGLALTVPENRATVVQVMRDRVQEAIANNPDPAARETIQRIGQSLATPSGLATMIIVGLVIFGLLFILLGGIGGAVGAALFGRPREE